VTKCRLLSTICSLRGGHGIEVAVLMHGTAQPHCTSNYTISIELAKVLFKGK